MANLQNEYVTDVVQFATFTMKNQLFGVDILQMREIIQPIEITKVPRAPSIMEGVINLRGQVIPIISLRKRFGLPAKPFDKETRIINMQIDNMIVGFIVDSIDHVRRVAKSAIEEPPAVTATVNADAVSGIINNDDSDEGGLILILDMAKLISNVQLEDFIDGANPA